jgi:holo-[acyl-carrier protein] synthase
MVKGIGVDLAQLSRFVNKDEKFVAKILTSNEIAQYQKLTSERKVEYLAGRFAAKEAYYKAQNNVKIGYHDVEILDDYFKGPVINNPKAKISISHDGDYVVALVVVEE